MVLLVCVSPLWAAPKDGTMKNKSVKSRVRDAAARSSIYQRALMAGAGSAFDLGGTYLKIPEPGSLERDAQKLRNDFSAIGADFKSVFRVQLKGMP